MSTLSAPAPSGGLTPSDSTQTIKARHHYLPIEPPSYLSTAVRALKGTIPILTPPSNARTKGPFKPRSSRGTTSYQLRKFAEETLGSGSLRKAVKLPEGEDVNEWLAVNGILFTFCVAEDAMGLIGVISGRLLQSDQSAIWLYYRVLLAAVMSRDESYR